MPQIGTVFLARRRLDIQIRDLPWRHFTKPEIFRLPLMRLHGLKILFVQQTGVFFWELPFYFATSGSAAHFLSKSASLLPHPPSNSPTSKQQMLTGEYILQLLQPHNIQCLLMGRSQMYLRNHTFRRRVVAGFLVVLECFFPLYSLVRNGFRFLQEAMV